MEETQAVTEVAPQADATQAAQTQPTQDVGNVESLPQWAKQVISDLRKEAAGNRTAKTRAEQAAQAAADEAAKEQGRWQQLAEKYEPEAKRAAELTAFVDELLEQERASVPERFRALIPAGNPLDTLRWVRAAKEAGILTPPTAPQTDAQETGRVTPRMTEAEKRERAARLGVDWRYLPD